MWSVMLVSTGGRMRPVADEAVAWFGSLLVAVALTIIWVGRLGVSRDLYVSELGADGEPTEAWFEAALLLLVAGGSAVAWTARRVRATVPLLALWTPAVSLWVGCGFFLLASQVNCTSGCPLPVGDTFTWRDFVHTVAAVLAFAAGCVAMLQVSFSAVRRPMVLFSRASGLAVAAIAGVGGLLSLAEWQTGFGSRLELAATTVGLIWMCAFGVGSALSARRALSTPDLAALPGRPTSPRRAAAPPRAARAEGRAASVPRSRAGAPDPAEPR